MSVNVTVNNVIYPIPQTDESGWGDNVTSWIQAVSSATLQKSGGTFTLTSDADMGAGFGLKSIYYKSRGTVATTGILRLANLEGVYWRNAANSANLGLTVDASDNLVFNGTTISPSGGYTASRAIVSDGSGDLTASTVTTTELGLLSGVTGTLVTTTASQTLTNKTITIAGSGTRLANYDGSNNLTSLANGSNGQYLSVSGGVPTWAAVSQTINTAAKTANYTIDVTDGALTGDSDGGAFTFTLPDCATAAGRVFKIKKVGTSFATANQITIACAGADTIFDSGSGTSVQLNTPGEEVEICSFGSTVWQVLNRQVPSVWTSYTPTTTGFGTISGLIAHWMRQRQNLFVRVFFNCGTVTATTASVTYPSGITSSASVGTGSVIAVGYMPRGDVLAGSISLLAGVNDTKLYFGVQSATRAGTSAVNGDTVCNDTNAVLFTTGPIQIAGWTG